MAVQPNSVCHSGTTVFVFPRNAKKTVLTCFRFGAHQSVWVNWKEKKIGKKEKGTEDIEWPNWLHWTGRHGPNWPILGPPLTPSSPLHHSHRTRRILSSLSPTHAGSLPRFLLLSRRLGRRRRSRRRRTPGGGGGPSGVLWIDLPSRVGKEALTFNRLLIFPAGVFLCGEPSNPSLSAAPLTRPVCASAWWSFQSDYLCLQEILVGLSALTDEAMTTCCVGWGSCRLRAMHRRETKTSQD
jgi:hypothetical protein